MCITEEKAMLSFYIDRFESCRKLPETGRCALYTPKPSSTDASYTFISSFGDEGDDEMYMQLGNAIEKLPYHHLYLAQNPQDLADLTPCTSLSVTATYQGADFRYSLEATCGEDTITGEYTDLIEVLDLGGKDIAFIDPNADFSPVPSIHPPPSTTKDFCVTTEETVFAYDGIDGEYKQRPLKYMFAIDFGYRTSPESS